MRTNRISSIDQFRGLAILLMVISNYMVGVMDIPAWLRHTPDIGLSFNDVIALFKHRLIIN